MIAQTISRHIKAPGIIVLLGVGILLGPDVLGWINPHELGAGLEMLIGIAVAVILFEGGLHLDLKRLKRMGKPIRRLITIGALLTAIGSGLAAYYIMQWDWRVCLLFGTLVIVTGPTVVTPLLRRIRVRKNIQTVLEAEGVLIDPIGAIIAVVCLEVVISTSDSHVAFGLVDLVLRLGLGVFVGLIGGFFIGSLLRLEKIVPEELENIFTLTLVLLLFEGSNALLPESGIMTVTVAGMVVGNMKFSAERRLVEFKEQLTTMLIGMLFVLLAADVRVADVWNLGIPGLLCVFAIMFIVRPINVGLSTIGSDLKLKEKLFISWLAPRGIVAAAVASLFAQALVKENISGGVELRALVFLVIAVTVVIQGFSSGMIATLLGVKRKTNIGFVIVGANALGRLVGIKLREYEEDIVFIDRNFDDCHKAEQDGFKVIYGNALEESIQLRSGIDSRRGIIGLTPNEGVNLMLTRKVREITKLPDLYIGIKKGTDFKVKMLEALGAKVLFADEIDFELWNHRIKKNSAEVVEFTYQGDEEQVIDGQWVREDLQLPENTFLPITVARNDKITPVFGNVKVKTGDRVNFLIFKESFEKTSIALKEQGW